MNKIVIISALIGLALISTYSAANIIRQPLAVKVGTPTVLQLSPPSGTYSWQVLNKIDKGILNVTITPGSDKTTVTIQAKSSGRSNLDLGYSPSQQLRYFVTAE